MTVAEFKHRPRTRNRLLIYMGQQLFGDMIAMITLQHFGGLLTWPEFRFAWFMVLAKVGLGQFTVIRAYLDRTPSEESDEKKEQARTDPPLM